MAWGFKHRPFSDEEFCALADAAEEHGDVLDEAIIKGLGATGLRIGEWTHLRRQWLDTDAGELRLASIAECDCGECIRERADPLREAREEVLESDKPFGEWRGMTEDGATINRYVKYARRPGIGRSRLDYYLDEHDGVWFPKSPSGARVVPIPDDEVAELVEWALELHGYRNCEQWPITRHGMSKRLKKLAEKAGVRDAHFHRFRHLYGVKLASEGFSAFEIKSAMGHSEIEQSETYVSFSGKRLRDSFDRKWDGY